MLKNKPQELCCWREGVNPGFLLLSPTLPSKCPCTYTPSLLTPPISQDVGDYFPEDYEGGPGFEEGMLGSQAKTGGGGTNAVSTPGMEDFGKGGYVIGGLEDTNIPEGFEFVPSSVPDGLVTFKVAASSKGASHAHVVKPFCMGYEDFYAGFTSSSHPTLTVQPTSGRMDRRGGEDTVFTVACTPNGQAGTFKGQLVVFLPDEGDKLTYDVEVEAY